ncbi:MAG TPA: hypothetical protein PKK06_08860 [Phycisphaerae bacterium]|nr:hypothetical protein [Phycisphaerae bacterium]HNU45319.1 hypothetical protein [Phycisphaerae bacterium]
MILKSDLVTAIGELNPTAEPAFLAEFSCAELTGYLERLRASAHRPARDDQYYLPFEDVLACGAGASSPRRPFCAAVPRPRRVAC